MRLTIAALGFELDVTFGPADIDEGSSLDGGTTASLGPVELSATDTTLGFTLGLEVGDDRDQS